LGYDTGTRRWKADLIYDGEARNPLMQTGWHQELKTPDIAYMVLMQETAIKVFERQVELEALAQTGGEGSGMMVDSGDESE
jgi:hypothetical protein